MRMVQFQLSLVNSLEVGAEPPRLRASMRVGPGTEGGPQRGAHSELPHCDAFGAVLPESPFVPHAAAGAFATEGLG